MNTKNRIITTLFISLVSISSFTHAVSTSTDVSFTEVHDWMFINGLTTMSEANFRGDAYVSRGEISKFFANYAIIKGLSKLKDSSECKFKDLEGYDPTLVPTIIDACEYGLVKGSNGYYYPHNNLTEAEALTVIIRAIVGFQNEAKSPRWTEYYNLASVSGILGEEDTLWSIGTVATRETVARWLYSSASQLNIEELVYAADYPSILAECLADKGMEMYGTERCSHCKNQKSLFGSDFAKITYIDCDANKQVCMDNGITGYPTWKDTEDNHFPGAHSLEELAEISGCQVY